MPWLKDDPFVGGSLGPYHSVLITNSGRIVTWGSNQYHQIDLGDRFQTLELDSPLPAFEQPFLLEHNKITHLDPRPRMSVRLYNPEDLGFSAASVSCGEDFSLAISSESIRRSPLSCPFCLTRSDLTYVLHATCRNGRVVFMGQE